MPKIKYIRPAGAEYEKLRVLLLGKKADIHATNAELAAQIGCSAPTVGDRIKAPAHLTLEELPKYARALGIQKEEFLAAIPW